MKNLIALSTLCIMLAIALTYKPSEEHYHTINVVVKTTRVIELDRATTYNAEASQCDSDPLTTANGSVIDTNLLKQNKLNWVALSRDLIKCDYRNSLYPSHGHWQGFFEFGDTIVVSSESMPHINGEWVVNDCMNARYSNSIDFLFDPKNNVPKFGVVKDIKIIF